MKIVLTRRLPGTYAQDLIDGFSEVAVFEEGRPLTKSELTLALEGADAAIVQLGDKLDRDVIPKSLRFVSTYSVGVDHLDLDALKAQSCQVSHTPGVLTESTADLTWALLLACARKLKPGIKMMEEGRFQGFEPELLLGKPLVGKKLGILGLGRIGLAVAQRSLGFQMEVLYHNRKRLDAQVESILGAHYVTLEELLSQSDFLSFHCPLSESTLGIITPEKLQMTKPDCVIVNTARGGLWSERELTDHLLSRPETLVGLDVYEREPEVSQELISLPNVTCLPHLGSANIPTRLMMSKICVEEALRFATQTPLKYAIL